MILVTGGTGLIGAHLLYHLLKDGEQVRAIYRSENSKQITREIFSCYSDGNSLFDRIDWAEGDMLDLPSLEMAMMGISDIYHCAAMVSYDPRDDREVMKVNIEGTANMVNMAIKADIRKFCFVSSIASFGRAPRNGMVTEDTSWENNFSPSTYSISKYHAELEVWRGMEEGLDVVIVNPSVVLGSGNWDRGSSTLFKRIWKGLPYYTKGINGYVDVLDVVSCMILLMKSPIKNQHFLLVSENLTFENILNTIADALERKRPTIAVNRFLAKLARWQESIRCKITGQKPFITKATVNIAFDEQHYSNEKVRKALDYQFTPVNETIARIAADFRRSFN